MPRWNELWESAHKPGLEAAMRAGHLNGFVVLTHAHGGGDNFKVIQLHSGWDTIDDTFEVLVETAGPEAFGEIFSLIESHHDNIWIAGIFGEDGN